MSTHDYEVHRAVVVSSNVLSGQSVVAVPALLGSDQHVSIPPTGLTKYAGDMGDEWNVPTVGSSVFVAVSADRTQFLWLTALSTPTNGPTTFDGGIVTNSGIIANGGIDAQDYVRVLSDYDSPMISLTKEGDGTAWIRKADGYVSINALSDDETTVQDIVLDGNVGIGTTPNYPIDVAGDINLSGDIRVNGLAQSLGLQRIDVQSFTASTNYTIPSDAKMIYVEMWSGGAGGNAGESDFQSTASGGAGGYPGFFEKGFFAVHNAGQAVPVVVGAGGAGGTVTYGGAGTDGVSFGGGGGAGGYSAFGNYLSVYGPNGGYTTAQYYQIYGRHSDYTLDENVFRYSNRIFGPTAGGGGGRGFWSTGNAVAGDTAGAVYLHGVNPIGTVINFNSPYPSSQPILSGSPGGPVDTYYLQGYNAYNAYPGSYTVIDGVVWYISSGAGGGGGGGASGYYVATVFGDPYVATYGGRGGDGSMPAGGGGGGGGATCGNTTTATAGNGGNGGNGLVQVVVFG